MSEPARKMSSRMVQHDILNLYMSWDTVPQAARNIGRRFRRGNPLLDVTSGLDPLKPEIELAFLNFYPQLRAFSDARLIELRET